VVPYASIKLLKTSFSLHQFCAVKSVQLQLPHP
jgi:hypothetical protein